MAKKKQKQWFEVLINQGEKLGTMTIASSTTIEGAIEKLNNERENSQFPLSIDKWQIGSTLTNELIEMTSEEKLKIKVANLIWDAKKLLEAINLNLQPIKKTTGVVGKGEDLTGALVREQFISEEMEMLQDSINDLEN